MTKVKLNKKPLVVKSNTLVEARYKLSLNELRLILKMISMIQPEDEDFKPYIITISEFIDMLGVQDGDKYSVIEKIANDLRIKTLRIYDSEEDSFLNVGWLSSSKYYRGEGYVKLRFDPELKPYLLGLKSNFTRYQLHEVARLKSTYSIRIYELLKQYQRIGYREFKNITELRLILGIENEYKLYGHFKDQVLRPAQKELKEKTDISFEFTEKKTGRAVTGIKFHIITKQPEPEPSIDVEYTIRDTYDEAIAKMPAYEQELFKRLQGDFKLSKKQAHAIITVYLLRKGKDYVETVLNYCNGYWQKALKIDKSAHIGAIAWVAFKDGWQVDVKATQVSPAKPAMKKREVPPEISEEERAYAKKMLADLKKRGVQDA